MEHLGLVGLAGSQHELLFRALARLAERSESEHGGVLEIRSNV